MSVDNKKFGGLGAFGRFLEKLREVFLPLSGGTLTGNIYTTPYYNSSLSNGGQVTVISKGKVAKGTNPSQSEYHTMGVAIDSSGTNTNAHKLGKVETTIATNGTVTTALTAYRHTSGSTASGEIAVAVTNTGAVSATAPTPAVATRGTNIATCGFVDTYNDTYVISTNEILTLMEMTNSSEKSY